MVEGISGLAQVIFNTLMREGLACKVIVKHDGLEALDYLLCRRDYAGRDNQVMPCVTLLDLALPNSDGLELLREIRTHKQTRLLPIVAFSSAPDEHKQVDAVYRLGANSYIGIRPGSDEFDESIRRVGHYWCVVNDPPPPPT